MLFGLVVLAIIGPIRQYRGRYQSFECRNNNGTLECRWMFDLLAFYKVGSYVATIINFADVNGGFVKICIMSTSSQRWCNNDLGKLINSVRDKGPQIGWYRQ